MKKPGGVRWMAAAGWALLAGLLWTQPGVAKPMDRVESRRCVRPPRMFSEWQPANGATSAKGDTLERELRDLLAAGRRDRAASPDFLDALERLLERHAGDVVGAPTVAAPEKWLVVDMRGGAGAKSWPVKWLDAPPAGGFNTDEYKTGKLVLRMIPAGTFLMGSPDSELGRWSAEVQHEVTLTKPYFIGVFPVTQRQWELATGTRPSFFANDACYATRPVEQVSYADIRGSVAGRGWPGSANVDEGSFLAVLRAKTGLAFDLPTEAQWERACRAGTTAMLNSGKDLTGMDSCPNMGALGRYRYNHAGGQSGDTASGMSAGTAPVGSYLPNAWGLYDMHGNVCEWCLDWYDAAPAGTAATDPAGPGTGAYRVLHGGSWADPARSCRAATRHWRSPSERLEGYGVRLSCTADGKRVRTAGNAGRRAARHRYEIVPWTGGWMEANADAEARGGHLATVTSAEEWSSITNQFGARLLGCWLGGTDTEVEGRWQWVTGEPWSFSWWGPGEPNGGRNQNYLWVHNRSYGSWRWDDCQSPYHEVVGYVLEIEEEKASDAEGLLHRWSFTGDFMDSVGGANGVYSGNVACGWRADGKAVSLAGGNYGSSGVRLGRDVVPTDNSPFTVEIWATQRTPRRQSRIFELTTRLGKGHGSDMLAMGWSLAEDVSHGQIWAWKAGNDASQVENTASFWEETGVAPFSLGVEYHISAVVEPNKLGDGRTFLRFAKRDISTGKILAQTSGFVRDDWAPSRLAGGELWIGRSSFPNDFDAAADYDEVRVWKGTLTDKQLSTNARRGPDVLPKWQRKRAGENRRCRNRDGLSVVDGN